MLNWRKPAITLLAAASFACALLPSAAFADDAVKRVSAQIVLSSTKQDESLLDQIRDTYTAAKKRAKRKSFKGKCGAYVNHQLVILGINTKYIGCNGNREYDVYYKKSESTGGYTIRAYGAKKYTLQSALEAIEKENPSARNILIGFQKGTSKAGKKYGHTLLIHGIENGMVYFSDSFAQKVDGKKYKEGEP